MLRGTQRRRGRPNVTAPGAARKSTSSLFGRIAGGCSAVGRSRCGRASWGEAERARTATTTMSRFAFSVMRKRVAHTGEVCHERLSSTGSVSVHGVDYGRATPPNEQIKRFVD